MAEVSLQSNSNVEDNFLKKINYAYPVSQHSGSVKELRKTFMNDSMVHEQAAALDAVAAQKKLEGFKSAI